jgi:disulfide bond formation protein DsbB
MTPVPPVALPPQVRAIFYYVIALAGSALGIMQTIYLAVYHLQPLWLTIALAVYAGVSAAFGVTAASNTAVPPTQPVVVETPVLET